MEHDAFHVAYLSDKIPEDEFHGQAVKTVAYLRVSTAQQDVGSQRLTILEYARKHDFRIDDFIEATTSGQASEKRRRLDELMNVLQRGAGWSSGNSPGSVGRWVRSSPSSTPSPRPASPSWR